MKSLIEFLTPIVASIITFVAQLLGGWDAALSILFLFMALDILTGVINSFHNHSALTPTGGFRSSTLFTGLTHKLLILLLVIVGTALDMYMGSTIARSVIIGFYAANEALSIIENAAIMGVPFPKGLLNSLQRFRDYQDNQSPWKDFEETDDIDPTNT